jgi:ribose transport system permease protein
MKHSPRAVRALSGRGRPRLAASGQAPLLILAAVLLFALLRYDGFYNSFNIALILSSTDMICIGLMAIGLTFTISLAEIDLSVSGIAVTSSVLAAYAAPHGIVASLAAAMFFGLVAGLVNGLLVAYGRLPSFIVSLAMLLALRGLSLILAVRKKIPIKYSSELVQFYNAKLGGLVPLPFLLLLAICLVAWLVYSRTPFGLHVLAIGGNGSAAELMGLRPERIRCAVFMLTGALSGLAGAFLAAKTTTGNPLEAQGWETSAIAAVVLGGTLLSGGKGSVPSTLVGVSLLTIVFQILNYENGQGIEINSYWQNVIRGLFVLGIVVAQGVAVSRSSQRGRAKTAEAAGPRVG